MNAEYLHDNLTEEFLTQYQSRAYDRPAVTVDVMTLRMKEKLDGLQILLMQRKDHPCIYQWALPGGLIDINESAYQAACSTVQEETGLNEVYLEQLYTMSQPDRVSEKRVIDITYIALVPYESNAVAKAGEDEKAALWFDISMEENKLLFRNKENDIRIEYELKEHIFKNGRVQIKKHVPELSGEKAFAFDHAAIIWEGLMRLHNKIMYTDIAFNLVPEEFTMPDLKKVFEIILGKELYRANFQDKMKEKVEETGKRKRPISSRKPSKLYRYKPD